MSAWTPEREAAVRARLGAYLHHGNDLADRPCAADLAAALDELERVRVGRDAAAVYILRVASCWPTGPALDLSTITAREADWLRWAVQVLLNDGPLTDESPSNGGPVTRE